MKLNKLTSAVSVSLLAVALTACGSDDDAPIIGSTPAPTTTTPAPTPAPVDNTAKIAEIKANAIAAGLTDANATAFANASVNLPIGSDAYNAALREALANQNKANTGDSNNVVSPVVVDKNFKIPGVDATKQATVTANHYARQPGSNFDRTANPEEYAGLGAVGTDDPTVQNPYLSNYVLAVEVTTDSTGQRKVVAIDSTGELVKDAGAATGVGTKVAGIESPYATSGGLEYSTESTGGVRNFHYGAPTASPALPANSTAFNHNNTVANEGTSLITAAGAGGPTNGIAGGDAGKIHTIQELNVNNVAKILAADATAAYTAASTATTAQARGTNGELTTGRTNVDSGLVVYNKSSTAVGGIGKDAGYKVPVYGSEENIYATDRNGNLVVANAVLGKVLNAAGTTLLGDVNNPVSAEVVPNYTPNNTSTTQFNEAKYGAVPTTGAPANDVAKAPLTTAVANNFETRVFGKNYNSYESGATGSQSTANSYVARYNSKNKIGSAKVTATTLQNVQYGRLTNNIDVLTNKKDTDPTVITYRQFQEHGAPNTVDTYFYRGTNHTTLAQMDALKARGGSVQYFGHALTYGIGPKVATSTASNNLPTAYGLTSSEATIGNFVQAKYDIAKSTVDGSIYNFINENVGVAAKKDDFTRQDLVTFSGNVVGNTVVGTSTKLGATPETGSLTASFFGANANEIGGQVSSIQRSEGYGSPKWGAVFGATRGTTIENFNVIEQGQ